MSSIGQRLKKNELSRIKRLLPLHEMAEHFGHASKSMRPESTTETTSRRIGYRPRS